MSRSTFWSVSQSTARVVLATTAAATLAIIGACADGSVASNIAPPTLRLGESVGPSIAQAKLATICVSSTSPDGTYTFQNSATNLQSGTGTTILNALDGVGYTLTKNVGNPNPCVDVLTRSAVVDSTAVADFPMPVTTVTNTITPAGVAFVSTDCVDDPGVTITDPCGNPSTIHANKFHGSKSTFNFTTTAIEIGTPQFVVGDLAEGLQLAAALKAAPTKNSKKNTSGVNFWGSQWWKNNPMTQFHDNGWPSFKGYATTADNFCGGTWTSRVGNSPPPPATISDDINVIVTSNVWKDGPDIRGNIKQIIVVHQDGGYGPNPGHDGNGPVVNVLCSSQANGV